MFKFQFVDPVSKGELPRSMPNGKVEKDAYPYVFFCSSKPEFSPIPTDYVFLDADGNELA